MKVVLLFPGQGAQYVGMGAELRSCDPAAAAIFEQASCALGFDLADVCEHGPADVLTRTLYAQPAVVATSLAALAALGHALERQGLLLDLLTVAGHSVGELAAMAAAGAFDVASIMHLVAARARAMERACLEVAGGMAAVLGLEAERVADACRAAMSATGETVEPANYNAPDQVVIAGTRRALAAAAQELERMGARRVLPLNVAGPFHTPLMRPAAVEFAGHLRSAEVRPPHTSIVLNGTGREATAPAALRAELAAQVAAPVQWARSMARCAELGVEAFIEVGPGQVLSGLARRAARGVPTFNVQDEASLEATLNGLTLRSVV